MDKNVTKYGLIGLGVIVVILLFRGGSSGGSGNAGATLQSFADTNATGVKLAAITAQRDIAAIQATTDRAKIVGDLFNSQTVNDNTITLKTLTNSSVLTNTVLTNSALLEQSHIASALAISLNNTNNDTTRYGIDAEKYITDSNNKLAKTLGMYSKDATESGQKIGAINNLVSTVGSVFNGGHK